MRTKIICLALWGSVFLFAADIAAARLTGNEFMYMSEEHRVMWTAGFLNGIDALGVLVCPERHLYPEGVTTGQFKDIVLKYLKNNPTIRNRDLAALALLALFEAFGVPPCVSQRIK